MPSAHEDKSRKNHLLRDGLPRRGWGRGQHGSPRVAAAVDAAGEWDQAGCRQQSSDLP